MAATLRFHAAPVKPPRRRRTTNYLLNSPLKKTLNFLRHLTTRPRSCRVNSGHTFKPALAASGRCLELESNDRK